MPDWFSASSESAEEAEAMRLKVLAELDAAAKGSGGGKHHMRNPHPGNNLRRSPQNYDGCSAALFLRLCAPIGTAGPFRVLFGWLLLCLPGFAVVEGLADSGIKQQGSTHLHR